ncbi:MAG: hypothetical protein ACOCSQ_01165 [Planctomycetota bacterium]
MSGKREVFREKLNSAHVEERLEGIRELRQLVEKEEIRRKNSCGWVNMHAHTFFSYNGYGYSPARFAWEAYRRGLEAAGIVDFDCLDGTEEFLQAGRELGMKTTAGFETRVFVREYRDKVINSPKEPGVFYLVGTGFVHPPEPDSDAGETLSQMQRRAEQRNRGMLRRLNDHLTPLEVDYEADILPLTAAGNATERHMAEAIEMKAREKFGEGDAASLIDFWSDKLDVEPGEIADIADDVVALKGLIRSRLMKHGGVGYVQPDGDSFPDLEEVVEMTRAEGAMPSGCWLDGTTDGERDPLEHFAFLRDKGCVSITIIPDRNWNVADEERALKVTKLNEAIAAAKELDMPVLAGTEMNKYGSKLVDDFDSEALAPHLPVFRRGAHIVWGHTLLTMTAGMGYVGRWAEQHFGARRAEKNAFFRKIGEVKYPDADAFDELCRLDGNCEPADVRKAISG